MNSRKILLTILSALTVIAMLASCVATPPQETAPAAEAAQPAASSEEKITLRWANIIAAAGIEQWQPVIDAFEAEYPKY